MSFDPICGEGVGNAIRQAILGCAAIEALADGSPFLDYSMRLMLGFLRHLEMCREFYRLADLGDWWTGELAALEDGIARIRRSLETGGRPKYRMVDFRLERI